MNRMVKSTGSSRGVFAFIIACLLLSGLLRFIENETAIAEEMAAFRAADTNEAPPSAKSPEACKKPAHIGPMLKAIQERQKHLEEGEARLWDRMQALNVAEKRLARTTSELVAAEAKLAATLAIADKAAENDLSRLTTVYETMKPKNAAQLFAEMAPEFAAGFLGRMRPSAAAQIMSALPSDGAYSISLFLAGRNAGAPKE